eukprot:6203944-Pleurochrysis_carterae.AAC.4
MTFRRSCESQGTDDIPPRGPRHRAYSALSTRQLGRGRCRTRHYEHLAVICPRTHEGGGARRQGDGGGGVGGGLCTYISGGTAVIHRRSGLHVGSELARGGDQADAVSYTHLTLPTILLV